MAVMCIDRYSDDVIDFFMDKALKKKKGFVIFEGNNFNEKITDSIVVLTRIRPTKKLVRFIAVSRARGNQIVYFREFFKDERINAMVDFYGIVDGKKLRIFDGGMYRLHWGEPYMDAGIGKRALKTFSVRNHNGKMQT